MNAPFDPEKIVFSRYGSWWSVFPENGALVLQNNRRHRSRLFTIAPLSASGEPLEWDSCEADPTELRATAGARKLRVVLQGDRALLIESNCSADLSLHPEAAGFGISCGDHERFYSTKAQATVYVTHRHADAQSDFRRSPTGHALRQVVTRASLRLMPTENGLFRARLMIAEQDQTVEPGVPELDGIRSQVRSDWDAFTGNAPVALRTQHCDRAWYNLWSSTLRAEGLFHQDGILMSKRNMTGVWSWDHCFNALAVSKVKPGLALDQVRLILELQAENGALPDVVQVSHARWIYAKPPIHGWTLNQLSIPDRAELRWFYDRVSKSTRWWMTCRDLDGSGFPTSIHPNDGGWDNSTLFDDGLPLAAPELLAYLILQAEWLEQTARELAIPEVSEWEQLKVALLAKLVQDLWVDGRFCGRLPFSGELVAAPQCLETCLPILLGSRLPEEIFTAVAKQIEKDFLTDFGVATESPRSTKYLDDGYWRGPVWAPSTYLIVEGLREGGERALAALIAERFCQMVEASGGFYENYSATDGRGLCDPGYTWTSAVYLLLKNCLSTFASSSS